MCFISLEGEGFVLYSFNLILIPLKLLKILESYVFHFLRRGRIRAFLPQFNLLSPPYNVVKLMCFISLEGEGFVLYSFNLILIPLKLLKILESYVFHFLRRGRICAFLPQFNLLSPPYNVVKLTCSFP